MKKKRKKEEKEKKARERASRIIHVVQPQLQQKSTSALHSSGPMTADTKMGRRMHTHMQAASAVKREFLSSFVTHSFFLLVAGFPISLSVGFISLRFVSLLLSHPSSTVMCRLVRKVPCISFSVRIPCVRPFRPGS